MKNREHAKELGNALPTTPIIFDKPISSIITQGSNIEVIIYITNFNKYFNYMMNYYLNRYHAAGLNFTTKLNLAL
jgi:hypothetical protein